MALRATQRRVRARQRVVGVERVIELRIQPVGRRVAGVAGVRQVERHVARIAAAREVRLVASEAVLRQRCVVSVRVALRACDRGMGARQGEHRRVIERRRHPSASGMAESTIGRETGGYVVGARRSGKVPLVARVAVGGRIRVTVVHVALRTGQRRMLTGQRILRVQRVIELGVHPVRRRVARVARVRESQGNVTWIIAVVEVS